MRKRRPRWVTQFGDRQSRELKQRGVVNFLRHVVEVLRRQFKALAEHFPDDRIGARPKLQPDHWLVATLANLFLNEFTQARSRIVIELDFSVASQPYDRDGRNLHPVIKLVKIAANDFAKLYKKLLTRRDICGQRNPLS